MNVPAAGRLVDLTCPLSPATWTYGPAFPRLASGPVTSIDRDGYLLTEITLPTHLGTHTDARSHLVADGWTIGEVPLERYLGWADVIRIEGLSPLEPIDAGRLSQAEASVTPGHIALLATGWDARLDMPDYATSHPFLTLDAADWLIERGVLLVGADLPGLMDPRIDLGPGARPPRSVDEDLLTAGIPYVVGLVRVTELDRDLVWFSGLPLRLHGLDGSPVRAVAIEPTR